MNTLQFVILACVAACAVSVRPVEARRVYTTSFDNDPTQAGWIYSAKLGPENWSKSEGRNGSKCIFTREGTWESPMIPVVPGRFYKSTLYAKVTPRPADPERKPSIGDPKGPEEFPAYWAVFYYDADGKLIDSDHYASLDLAADWTKREYVTCGKPRATHMRLHVQTILGTGVAIDDVKVEEITDADAATWSDELFASMPPYTFHPAENRWKLIPHTMERLRKGPVLRVVQIGDSISNDIANSQWHALVERMYPKCHIELIPAVRGGTPIGWFADPANVKERVIDNNPDLLIIASLNHGKDPDAVTSIIKQVRAATKAEIILMTPAVGPYDVTVEKDWRKPLLQKGDRQCDALYKVAVGQKVEFIDTGRYWGDYITHSKKPYRWYLRDFVHSNQRGGEVLARAIAAYLAPK